MNIDKAPEQPVSVVSVVSDAREAVMDLLSKTFGFDSMDLWEVSEIIAVLQSIPPQLVEDVGIAILTDFLDRHTVRGEKDRQNFLGVFDRVLAANIATATNIVMHNLREQQARQAEMEQRLRSGFLAR